MATTVKYNGVTLSNVETLAWDEDVTYDDTGATRLFTKLQLTFRCLVHAQKPPGGSIEDTPIHVSTPGRDGHATDIYKLIRTKLQEPRRELTVAIDNTEPLTVNPYRGEGFRRVDGDVDNGPKPRMLKIESIKSDKAYRIVWSVEATVVHCSGTDSTRGGLVLSNRWSVTESMDENYIITRSIRGSLRIAATRDTPRSTEYGHRFKPFTVPGLEKGFRRISADYQVDKSGNTCSYTVIDRQMRYAPPWPATKMSARHAVESSDGVKLLNAIQVSLEGPVHANIGDLLQRAFQIAQYRLNYFSGNLNPDSFDPKQLILQFSLSESIGDVNGIDLSMVVMQNKEGADIFTELGAVTAARFGQLELGPIKRATQTDGESKIVRGSDYQINRTSPPAFYGYDPHLKERSPAVLAVLHSYLGDPCDGLNKGIAQGSAPSRTRQTGRKEPEEVESTSARSPTVTGSQVENVDQLDPARYQSAAAADAVYTYSAVSSCYVNDHGYVALPLSELADDGAGAVGFFKLGSAQSYRIVKAESERVGGPPKIPAPAETYTDGGLRARLFYDNAEVLSSRHSVDGTKTIERIRSTYVYVFNRKPGPDEVLRVGRNALMPANEKFAPASRSLNEYQDASLDPAPRRS